MHRYLKASLLASALTMATVPTLVMPTPGHAAVNISISFDYFHNSLSDYGDWVYSSRWGRVWRPDVDADFRPYTRGHWVYTEDYGWFWVSDEPFGDITYHYGRWVNDPYDGWLWIPGYVWGPAWVVWRSGSDYTGWMPMPPTEAFLEGDETSYDISDDYDYGYRRWYPDYSDTAYASLWIFVGNRYIGDRNYRRYAVQRPRVRNIIHRTRNVTNYTIVNNYVVNRSVNVDSIRRAGGRVQRVRAASVVKSPALITRADKGREIQARMRKQAPHGNGKPDSAPAPTAEQIKTLSPTIRTRGKKPVNLMTRAKAEELRERKGTGRNGAETGERKQPETKPPENRQQENTKQENREQENRQEQAKPEAGTPQTRQERRRERNEPAAAKPAETTPDRNKPGENRDNERRDNERRNNVLQRTDKLPAENKPAEKPAAQTPEKPAAQQAPKPERIQRPMREERVQPKENAAPAPAPVAKPPEPDRSRMQNEMRDERQERANERARERAAEPAKPAGPAAAPQRAQPPEAPMREQMRERVQQRAKPPAAEQQREKPADKEKRDNRGDRDKDKRPRQPNE